MSVKQLPEKWLYVAALLLLFPALLINLGLMTFIDDEAIRSLVALEMKLSGNYIAPTLHGEFYYNKPPLYNWFLLLFFNAFGQINEFTARLSTLFCLLGYAATVYYYFRKHFDARTAFLNAFFLITCGRILFWDSLLGLIDIGFSWITFTLFMVIFHEFERGNWRKLFLLSYLLTAAGFMMKGLPAVVFQGTTLLVWFVLKGQFRRLFSVWHFVGGVLFLAIVGAYYFAYHQYNSLENVFTTLFSESSKRTVVQFGWWKTVLHFFTFPFEMVYHFLPWSLMILYCLRKDFLQRLREHPLMLFNAVAFLANILIYWTSPEVYPRYLLMLNPLLFSMFLYLHPLHEAARTWQYKTIQVFLLSFCIGIAGLSFLPLFLERTQGIPYLALKTLPLIVALVLATYWMFRAPDRRLLLTVFILLIFRIGFNWFVLPDRHAEDFGTRCRSTTIEAGKLFPDRLMYVYKDIDMQPTTSFYLTNARKKIIPVVREMTDSSALYIINPGETPGLDYQKVGEFLVRHGERTYDVGQIPYPKTPDDK